MCLAVSKSWGSYSSLAVYLRTTNVYVQCSVLGRKATERERKKTPENESESKRVFRSSRGGISIMKEDVLCRLVWKRCQRLFKNPTSAVFPKPQRMI